VKCKAKMCICVLLAVLIAAVMPFSAYAATVIDYTKSGSINITMLTPIQNKPIAGLQFDLYFVGAIDSSKVGLAFIPAGDFASAGVSFLNMTDSASKSAAKELADYAASNGISGTPEITPASGQVQFSPLELGLYLIVPGHLPSGSSYKDPVPFLVSLPITDIQGTGWDYAVNVYPKLELKHSDPGTTAPTTTHNGETTTDHDIPKTNDPSPVWLLAGLGITLTALLGLQLIFLKKTKKKANNDSDPSTPKI